MSLLQKTYQSFWESRRELVSHLRSSAWHVLDPRHYPLYFVGFVSDEALLKNLRGQCGTSAKDLESIELLYATYCIKKRDVLQAFFDDPHWRQLFFMNGHLSLHHPRFYMTVFFFHLKARALVEEIDAMLIHPRQYHEQTCQRGDHFWNCYACQAELALKIDSLHGYLEGGGKSIWTPDEHVRRLFAISQHRLHRSAPQTGIVYHPTEARCVCHDCQQYQAQCPCASCVLYRKAKGLVSAILD